MSGTGKIKAKDLSYDSSLPPFLQRLHDQNAGRGDTDRHERAIARPRREKDPNEDDGPTVVDETGDTLSKEEYEKLTKDSSGGGTDGSVNGTVTGDLKGNGAPEASGALPKGAKDDSSRGEQKMTDGLATKKRKVAKVVGDKNDANTNAAAEDVPSKKVVKMTKKKSKPIKLAFDDEGG